ncbi:MAG: HlyD family efflux transporter periplasmic adaptor subunit [Alphaproteobacteria bacterium]|nr:HlyD family efflux transporter periplasmic adaptor subunit [Alphaproteobacteria bacterium]
MKRPGRWLATIALWPLVAVIGACEGQSDDFQGYAEGEYVRVSVPEAGLLEDLFVVRGQMVDAAAPLFALERGRETAALAEAQARVAQARANLENLLKGSRDPEIATLVAELGGARAELELARINLGRQRDLAARDFASDRAVDEARTNVERWTARVAEIDARIETAGLGGRSDEVVAAEAALAAGEAALTQARWYLERRSPVAVGRALVHDTLYRPGEFVVAGRPVVTLLPPENVLVRFFVPETQLGAVALGDRVSFSCDGCAEPIAGHITYISGEAEYTPPVIYSRDSRAKLVFLVEAHPDDRQDGLVLHPGQPIDVELVE